jgi:dTDP-glucose pyrophosphorylase
VSERLDNCKIHHSKRLVDAMWTLEKGGAEIALVVDDSDRLIGTLTDGDIRRALLGQVSLDAPLAPHVQRKFTSVSPETPRADVIELMRARGIGQIPILAPDGRLIGLHLLREIVGNQERPTWAVIMAGGQGRRLFPMTATIPKPMIRVAGRPILERIVLHLVGHGIRRIFLSVHYLAHVVEEHFGDGSQFGCVIEYLREDRPLGTGGALALLPQTPSAPFLVMNGDLVTQADIGAMLDAHERGGPRATLGVRRYFHTVPFGCVEVEGDRIRHMEEKPRLSQLVNAGIYVLDPSLLARLPQGEFGLPDLLQDCLDRGEDVRTFEIEGDWVDVGQRDQLKVAREGEGG